MGYRTDSAEAQDNNDSRHSIGADNLNPPKWFLDQEPPPIGVGDDDRAFENEWCGFGSERNRTIWRGSTWTVTVDGVQRVAGDYCIAFNDVWDAAAIRGALAVEPNDLDELREALRIARLIDAFWGDQP